MTNAFVDLSVAAINLLDSGQNIIDGVGAGNPTQSMVNAFNAATTGLAAAFVAAAAAGGLASQADPAVRAALNASVANSLRV
jgi:hypothetical protein